MYLIFDIETVVDHDLMIATYGKPGEDRAEAIQRISVAVCKGVPVEKCFIPAKFHRPVVYAMLAMDARGEYIGSDTFDARGPDGTKKLTERFWSFMAQPELTPPLNRKFWVSFNGKGFDAPVMTHWAYRYGISMEHWLPLVLGTNCMQPWVDPRNNNLGNRHLDLLHHLGGCGQDSLGGSLNYWSKTFGLPGKQDVGGDKVGEMWAQGQVDEIKDYCLTDCLNTAGCLLGFLKGCGYPVGPRSEIFEDTMIKTCETRPKSEILEKYWRAYGPTKPF